MVNGVSNNHISVNIEITILIIIGIIRENLSEEAIALLDFYHNFKKKYGNALKMTVIQGEKFDYETNLEKIKDNINNKTKFVFTDFEQTITNFPCIISEEKNEETYIPDTENKEAIHNFFFVTYGLQNKRIDFVVITDMENSDIEKNGKNCLGDKNWSENHFVYNKNVFGMPSFLKQMSLTSYKKNIIELIEKTPNTLRDQKPKYIEYYYEEFILGFLKAINKLKCIDEYLFKKAKLAAPVYALATESTSTATTPTATTPIGD